MPDYHKNPVVSVRVPNGEAEEWKSVFRQALMIGLGAAASRLASDGGALEALWDPLDRALPEIQRHWPGPGDPPDSPEGLLEWLTTLAPEACALWAETQQTQQSLRQARAELTRIRQEVAAAHSRSAGQSAVEVQAIEDQIAAERERWGLTREGTHMVAAMAEAGWTTEELIAWGKALQASQAEPRQLVELWQRLGGLEGQIAALTPQLHQLEAIRRQLEVQIQQWGAKTQEAEAEYHRARELQAAARRGLADLEAEVERSQATAAQWRQIAGALAWWIPDIGQTWVQAQGQPAGIERALAATLLLHAVQTTGDVPITIPGSTNPRSFRLPVSVRLSDLLSALAPPEMVQSIFARAQSTAAPAEGQPSGEVPAVDPPEPAAQPSR